MENSSRVKGADYARNAVMATATNKNRSARIAMARAAITIGNYDESGKDIWRDYLALDCPAKGN